MGVGSVGGTVFEDDHILEVRVDRAIDAPETHGLLRVLKVIVLGSRRSLISAERVQLASPVLEIISPQDHFIPLLLYCLNPAEDMSDRE